MVVACDNHWQVHQVQDVVCVNLICHFYVSLMCHWRPIDVTLMFEKEIILHMCHCDIIFVMNVITWLSLSNAIWLVMSTAQQSCNVSCYYFSCVTCPIMFYHVFYAISHVNIHIMCHVDALLQLNMLKCDENKTRRQ